MRKCNTVFTKGECEGHFGGKFADCIAESLESMGLDWADDDTGSIEFEGHLMLFLLDRTEGADVDGDGERLSLVPPGNYILFTSDAGSVSLWEYDTKDLAVDEISRWDKRYQRWDQEEY